MRACAHGARAPPPPPPARARARAQPLPRARPPARPPARSHHRYYECNYAGSNAGVLDVWFGTFMGAFKESEGGGVRAREDAKSTIVGVPTAEFVAYLALSAACVAAWAHAANAAVLPSAGTAAALALLAGFGPVAIAFLCAAIWRTQGGAEAKGAHYFVLLAAGSAVCALPVAWAAYLALRPPLAAGRAGWW